MSDTPNDELRLRETKVQMRRALGLNDQPSTSPGHAPSAASTGADLAQPHRRRFVGDGEVPVTVIHRDQRDAAGTNALKAARQGLREQVAAREHAEHLLQKAQATIHDLQTKLAHERLAKDEAVQGVDSEKQVLGRALQSCGRNWLPSRSSGEVPTMNGTWPLQPARRLRNGRGRCWSPKGYPEGIPGVLPTDERSSRRQQ